MYAVKIVLKSGAKIDAVVTRHTLRNLNMKACASVSWSRVRS